MTHLSPLTEDEARRRRRMSGTLGDGEYVSFDITLRDSRPGAAFMTDGANYSRAFAAARYGDMSGLAHLADQSASPAPAPSAAEQAFADQQRRLSDERTTAWKQTRDVVRDSRYEG